MDDSSDIEVPQISSVTHVRTALNRPGTDISFVDGVTLKFSGKISAEHAKLIANAQYKSMLEAGFNKEEIRKLAAGFSKEEVAQIKALAKKERKTT